MNTSRRMRTRRSGGSMSFGCAIKQATKPSSVEGLESRVLLSRPATNPAAEALTLSGAQFIENQGQWADSSIHFAQDGQGIHIGFTDSGAILEVLRPSAPLTSAPADAGGLADSPPMDMERARVTMSFENASEVAPEGVHRSPSSFNYLIGDASQHRSNVPAYDEIVYPNLYPGIDCLARGQADGMKYEFHVSPGADWRDIHVHYGGTTGLRLRTDGSLQITTPLGDLVERAPVFYQEVDGSRVPVAGHFILLDSETYAFEVTGNYDRSRELIIDPDLEWATYLGGSGYDIGWGIASDAFGNSYLTGYTDSAGWATKGSYDDTYNVGPHHADVFVAKVSAAGALLYATYLGGTGSDTAFGIAVDTLGDAYVTGETSSSGWAIPGAFDETFTGGDVYDMFVAKLNPSGSQLIYASYLGGSGYDIGYAIALDASGDAYITGYTEAAGLATPGAYDTTFNGDNDIIVAKFSTSGSSLLYATYLGGDSNDVGDGIAVDGSGNAYVTGTTGSAGWGTEGAYRSTKQQFGSDIFVAKLNVSGSSLLYATYLGGVGEDRGIAIAVDKVGNAYIAGETRSPGWATPGAFDTVSDSSSDSPVWEGFVAKFNASGSSLLYASYLGGSSDDFASGIAVDGEGNAYVTGRTASDTWAATPNAYETKLNGGLDAFLVKLNAAGSSILYGTYLGGSGDDSAQGVTISGTGAVYITGYTYSPGWATAQAYDTTENGLNDIFLVKLTGLIDFSPGDTNGDGKVNFADLVAVAQNYGGVGKTRAQGDVTGDGNVNFQDLVMVAQHYTTAVATVAAPAPPILPVLSNSIAISAQHSASGAVVANAIRPVSLPHHMHVEKPAVRPVAARVLRFPVRTMPTKAKFNLRKRIGDAVWN